MLTAGDSHADHACELSERDLRARAMRTACGHCYALPGEPCITRHGEHRKPHDVRRWRAHVEWLSVR